MYNYMIGKITEVDFNSITLENSGIGYLIYVANPYSFVENNEYKVYLYHNIIITSGHKCPLVLF